MYGRPVECPRHNGRWARSGADALVERATRGLPVGDPTLRHDTCSRNALT